MKHV